MLAVAAITLVLVVAYRALRPRRSASPAAPTPTPATAPITKPTAAAPVKPPEPTPVDQPPERIVEPTPSPPAANPSHLSVTDAAVGRRVNGRLVAGDRFRKGQVAAFETRVVGGKRGEQIRHVWKWNGRTMQTIALRIGNAQWRTYSTKTLNGPGPWTVEAQDARGAVLARAELVVDD
jgi:hypothetical protein